MARIPVVPRRPRPADLARDDTLAFVRDQLGKRKARILEVGCGKGAFALGLVALGHVVVGIDRSANAVAALRRAGFRAVHGDFLGDLPRELAAGPFDAVVFTRSLHHIHDLEGALERAHGLLVPGGRLLLEEFALESMDRATATWFQGTRAALGVAGRHAGQARSTAEPLDAWREEHAHEPPLHEGRAMIAAVRRRFRSVVVERVPYLYRYFCDALAASARGHAVARAVRDMEERLVKAGVLVPIGLRVVARRSGDRVYP